MYTFSGSFVKAYAILCVVNRETNRGQTNLNGLPTISGSKIQGYDQAVSSGFSTDIETPETSIEVIACVRWWVHRDLTGESANSPGRRQESHGMTGNVSLMKPPQDFQNEPRIQKDTIQARRPTPKTVSFCGKPYGSGKACGVMDWMPSR